MPASPYTVRKTEKIMDCPACGGEIKGDARIQVEMLEPTITQNGASRGEVQVETRSSLIRFDVSHRCGGVVGEPTEPTEPPAPPEPPKDGEPGGDQE